ncbi:MAG: GNAT family N-acetyltransferase [Firmicutes bacterium]|jgi:RimJ/RimL family protein N-acetyltransferase|nr:GNAT family N-acetyltransferase [Bacillota bacterium]
MNFIITERLKLKFASMNDRKKVYDLMISPEIYSKMFSEKFPPPTWKEFCDEGDHYFTGEANKKGSYLLIEFENEVIGSFCFTCEYEKIPYTELDIWMGKLKYTGKGLGREAINAVISFVESQYNIGTFIIRPWKNNINAIKAYKKCGFEEEEFDITMYYSDKRLSYYKDGYYGKNETCNLIRTKGQSI